MKLMKNITVVILFLYMTSSLTFSSSYAQNAKLVSQTTFVIPLQASSFQIVSIPFVQALSVESSFQIKVIKELPIDYRLKIGLAGKYIQKDGNIGPLQPGANEQLSFRIETPKVIQSGEIYAKIMIGSIEDSSYSAAINLYLLPVTPKEMQLTINKLQAIINGKNVLMDTAPLIIKGRTFVPFRFIGTELGAKIDFTTNPTNKMVETVTFQMGRKSIKLTIGSTLVEIMNDKEKIEKKLDTPPVIIKGRTLIPLRFVSEELGSSITWDGANSSIGIFFPKTDPKPEDHGNIFFKTITSEELQQMIVNKDKKFLLDIRVDSEFKKGHIPTAQNLYETYINEADLTKAGIQKSDKIIIYCNSGLHSIPFCEILTNSGYTDVYTLAKGLAGWTYDKEK